MCTFTLTPAPAPLLPCHKPLSDPDVNPSQLSIKLCECEPAMGEPNGLRCDKEGWFISDFENQGTWVSWCIRCKALHSSMPLAAHELVQAWSLLCGFCIS